jgi:heme exporter protein B
MDFLRQVFTIMAKDLRAELRTKEAVNASFAFDPTEETAREISGGLRWVYERYGEA